MWKAIAASVPGTSHVEQGRGCDDASLAQIETGVDGDSLIAVCCDGAGSASHSSIGAQISCQTFHELAKEFLLSTGLQSDVPREVVVGWCDVIRERLNCRASELGLPVRELACTFLGAIIGETTSLFVQIGDGAMVVRDAGNFDVVFWPQSGEFANTTNFLTQEDFSEWLSIEFRRSQIRDFAAFTDGLERLALKFADQTVHQPFFEALLQPLRGPRTESEFETLLRSYLDSPGINERTDDDKSLILAVRIDDGHVAATC